MLGEDICQLTATWRSHSPRNASKSRHSEDIAKEKDIITNMNKCKADANNKELVEKNRNPPHPS